MADQRTLLRRANMAYSQFDQFLQEATHQDPESDATLDRDAFYGLYTSWCFVSQNTPQAEPVFWKAMKQRLRPGDRLRMTGPAAADYILNSYQAVV
jgi:hypothetical protein